MGTDDSAFHDSFYWGLLSAREPKVLAGLKDFERLSSLYKQGEHKEVRRTLQRRADRAVSYWMRMLGAKRGRPVDQELREKWALAEIAEQRGFKRTQLIGLIDAGGLPDAAKDRLRKGIGTIKREKWLQEERKKKNL